MNILIIILSLLATLSSVICVVVGIWAITSQREKLYKEKSRQFKEQLERVQKDMEKREKDHGQ